MFHMYGWAFAHVWRSEVDVRRLPQSLSTSIHSGKVSLVLLASLPQGFCLCPWPAGITGSECHDCRVSMWVESKLWSIHLHRKYLICSCVASPTIYCFWSMLYHDSHTIPSKPVRHCIWPTTIYLPFPLRPGLLPPEWLIILIFTITKMSFVYVLIFLVIYFLSHTIDPNCILPSSISPSLSTTSPLPELYCSSFSLKKRAGLPGLPTKQSITSCNKTRLKSL